jgi:CHAT domain-containing protein/DNA-binding transcriptional regulator YbjK
MKAMWSFIGRLGVLLLLASLTQPLPHAWAQQVQQVAPTDRDLAAELSRLIERWQKTDDPEVQIAALEAALRLVAQIRKWPLQAPREQVRGRLLRGLGDSNQKRRQGSRADNLEAAIKAYEAAVTVRSQDWGGTQNNLGIAYSDRIKGSKADNLEAAIKAYEAALTVRTRKDLPRQWATTQDNLGLAYGNRIKGSKADNLEAAIKAYEAALTVRTRKDLPQEWAKTQTNLGVAYSDRIQGSKADNLEAAIKAYEAALIVLTREAFPEEWATTQNNLANAYFQRIKGSKADNMEAAIAGYEAALTVRTRQALPPDWAETQNNLAAAYDNRIKGSKADNLEAAIKAYEAALIVRTREDLPQEWAHTQYNLANAYRDRIKGSKADNLEAAIKSYKAALTVLTRDALPRDNLRTGALLGQALLDKHDWRAAPAVYAGARDAFLLLFGQGLEEAEAQSLIAEAGPLFAEAAYAAAETRDLPGALNLLSEGKARLMAVALRQQSLDLPPEKSAQLIKLKAEIRDWTQRAETQGEEGARALEHLVRLRQELGALLKEALANDAQTGGAIALARELLPEGGALVAPLITKVGGKVLLVTGSKDSPTLSLLALPELTTARLDELIKGPADGAKVTGWLNAFNIQYLPEPEKANRYPEWIGAIGSIGPDLWQLFAGALVKELTAHGVKPGARVIVLPTGALGLLPLGLAQDPATGGRLVETYEMVEAPSLEALAAAARRIATPVAPTLTVVINPTGLIPDLSLPFTETEGILVAAHFKPAAMIMLDKSNASPAAVLTALKDKSYWHFSSHGFFDWTDARRSGLLMKDSRALTIGRLLEERGALGRPRLVVLSACETGLYETNRNPDEFVGLPATFMELGAAGVLGALWQVDDMATALLMAKFYDLHMVQGLSPPAALKAAQAWLRTATRGELLAYGEAAAQKGQLASVKLAELQDMLRTRHRAADSRFATAWNILHKRAVSSDESPTSRAGGGVGDLTSQPFAHPYYWGAFVYTGL